MQEVWCVKKGSIEVGCVERVHGTGVEGTRGGWGRVKSCSGVCPKCAICASVLCRTAGSAITQERGGVAYVVFLTIRETEVLLPEMLSRSTAPSYVM